MNQKLILLHSYTFICCLKYMMGQQKLSTLMSGNTHLVQSQYLSDDINMKELAVFLQNVVQGGPGVNIEVREGRGRCLVANKQIEVGDVPVNNITFSYVSYH